MVSSNPAIVFVPGAFSRPSDPLREVGYEVHGVLHLYSGPPSRRWAVPWLWFHGCRGTLGIQPEPAHL
ncbi:hypothetical protein DHEL01_v202251 [Diaporthe helianthi]|uniref:Uncharacterized protein n=1 Tax=Diaporthe helianthi TaxID=158607 RepID=A0A2P5IA83_DIAHE|nr:hypothetical protein DHEL01_v202251 [Diaporthe helianthi]